MEQKIHELALAYASAAFEDDLRSGEFYKIYSQRNELQPEIPLNAIRIEYFSDLYRNAYSYFCMANGIPDPYDKED